MPNQCVVVLRLQQTCLFKCERDFWVSFQPQRTEQKLFVCMSSPVFYSQPWPCLHSCSRLYNRTLKPFYSSTVFIYHHHL